VYKQVLKCLEGYEKVLDIGCGSGWFARKCIEAGHCYIGVDYSTEAIEAAREAAPEAIFYEIDIAKDQEIIKSEDFDIVVFISFLEHIHNDLEVLEAIPLQKPVIFVVPNRLSKGHIRAFRSAEKVFKRYGQIIEFNKVFKMRGNRWIDWVISGIRLPDGGEFDFEVQEVK